MVSEPTIIEMMGLGRTPIREAIQRRAPSYMIRIHASRGIEIPATTVDVALPLNGLCLNLCGGGAAFLPSTVLARLGRTWRV